MDVWVSKGNKNVEPEREERIVDSGQWIADS